MSHSPEPWTYCESMQENGSAGRDPLDEGGFLDAKSQPVCWFGNSEEYYPQNGNNPSREDAARIVACINFCRELDTAFLEAHILKNPVPPDEWAGCREEQFACWAAVVRA